MSHKSFISRILFLLMLCLGVNTVAPADNSKVYVINIASSLKAFSTTDLPDLGDDKALSYYTVRFKYKNKIWNRLRLGFFNDKANAEELLKTIQARYPRAFIGMVPASEISSSKKQEVHDGTYAVEYLLVSAADSLISVASNIKLPSKPEKDKQQPVSKLIEADHYYIISLKTAGNLSGFEKIITHPVVSRHPLYISELEIDDRTWYQYRIGFFTDRRKAERIVSTLEKTFPLARLIRITKEEKLIATSKIRAYTAVSSPKLTLPPKARPAVDAETTYRDLVKKGTEALSNKDYRTSISIFSELLSYPENSYSMDSQELLGFSYELNNQISNAKFEYERYISLYPESSGATRVRQRLASLITARKDAPKDLREARKDKIDPKWEIYGSVSQFYRRDTISLDITTETDVTTINTTDKRVNISEIDTILNVNSRRRSNDYEIRTRFTGSHAYDLLGEDTSNKAPLSEMYIDVLDINNKVNGRLGRQTSSKGGVLGRFDGVDAGYQMSDWFKINATAGYQVTSVYHSADTDAFFNGIRADFGTFLNAWDFSLYYIKQNDGDITGREAVGTEFRYFHPRRSLFGLVDHDIMFDITNTFLLNGTWTFANSTTMNATVDVRQSPILTSRNALQGQTYASVSEMLTVFTEEEILQIAEDRTAEIETFILGVSHPFSDKYTLNFDITASSFSATTASAGVEAIPATGTDYFINSQLVGTGVFKQNDTSIIAINESQTSVSDTTRLSWNYRMPVTRHFRINPRASVAQRDNTNNTSQSIYGLAYKMDYRWGRNTSFEFEFGGESSDKTLVSGDEKNQIYFLNLGYQHSF